MAVKKYKLYRKMSIDEYDILSVSGLTAGDDCQTIICPKKCFSESLIAPYRLNPYRNALSQVIAEFSFPTDYRAELLSIGYELAQPIHSDRTYSNYQKYGDKNLYYKCHGSSIQVYNHEIDRKHLGNLNNNILDINIIDSNYYSELLLKEYFGVSRFESLVTEKNVQANEYYIQLPVDLAVLALRFNAIPSGGLNRFIKSRIVGKDYEYVDQINNHIFPVTLVLKVNNNIELSRIKNSKIASDTYAVDSQLLYRLNAMIESIRLVEYKDERTNYKYASDILNNKINISDILNNDIASNEFIYDENHITLSDAINIIECSKMRDYFISNITNINDILYLPSEYHGRGHAERVCLYSYLIATHLGLPENEIKSLIKASLLHDIGKENEYDEENHGSKGANKIEELALFMNCQESKNMVKFLVEAHALERDDLAIADLMRKYNIQNNSINLTILNILMDADAIDRTRFTVFGDASAGLNTDYLKIPFSHRLVSLSKAISKIYYDNSDIALTKKIR